MNLGDRTIGPGHIHDQGSILCLNAVPILTPWVDSIDVDTPEDLQLARLLVPVRRAL